MKHLLLVLILAISPAGVWASGHGKEHGGKAAGKAEEHGGKAAAKAEEHGGKAAASHDD
jgi:hypothetical protein